MADPITVTTATNGTAPVTGTVMTTEPTPTLADLQTELARLKDENSKLRSAQSNASADASKYKKALQERMTEQEREANETKELIEQLKADNAQLKRNQTLSEYAAGFMGLGFDADMARKAAEAEGTDFAVLIGTFKEFITARDKAMTAEALRNTPRPGTGATAPAVTKEEFDKMGYRERLKIFNEQPELYKELIK